MYGWEEDAPTIWLDFFNKKTLEAGLISTEEYYAIERIIHEKRPLKNDSVSGTINVP